MNHQKEVGRFLVSRGNPDIVLMSDAAALLGILECYVFKWSIDSGNEPWGPPYLIPVDDLLELAEALDSDAFDEDVPECRANEMDADVFARAGMRSDDLARHSRIPHR